MFAADHLYFTHPELSVRDAAVARIEQADAQAQVARNALAKQQAEAQAAQAAQAKQQAQARGLALLIAGCELTGDFSLLMLMLKSGLFAPQTAPAFARPVA